MSMQGLGQLVETTREVRKYLNDSIEIAGLLPNNLDRRAGLVNEGLEALKESYGDLVFETAVPWRSKIIEVSTYGTTLYEHAPGSDAVEVYESLAQEVVSRVSDPSSESNAAGDDAAGESAAGESAASESAASEDAAGRAAGDGEVPAGS
jgi:cellulose biosynthesis protein BcsQ